MTVKSQFTSNMRNNMINLDKLTLRELYDLADEKYNELFKLQEDTPGDTLKIKEKQFFLILIEERIGRLELIKRFGTK